MMRLGFGSHNEFVTLQSFRNSFRNYNFFEKLLTKKFTKIGYNKFLENLLTKKFTKPCYDSLFWKAAHQKILKNLL